MINRSMMQASVTMGQLQKKMDIIGNNMANSDTTGFKGRQANFSSLLFQQIDNMSDENHQVGRDTPAGVRLGSGAKLGHTNIDLRQGSIKDTGRPLDAALLKNNHLFQLQVPTETGTETQYTRAGNFYMSPVNDGQVMLTNSDGIPVMGDDGDSIVLEDDFESLSIRSDGGITVTRGGEEAVEAQINVVEAIRPRMLETTGDSRFRIPDNFDAEGIIENVALNDTKVEGGRLEGSNVDMSQQMTDMLMTQRSYQFNAKSISTGDQMMGLVNQLRS